MPGPGPIARTRGSALDKNTSSQGQKKVSQTRWVGRTTRTVEEERERDTDNNETKDCCQWENPPLATITFQACSGYPAHPRRTSAECVGCAAASKFHRHLRQAVHGDHGPAVAAPHINCSTRHVAPCADRTIAETQTIVFKRRENTTRNHEPTRTHART